MWIFNRYNNYSRLSWSYSTIIDHVLVRMDCTVQYLIANSVGSALCSTMFTSGLGWLGRTVQYVQIGLLGGTVHEKCFKAGGLGWTVQYNSSTVALGPCRTVQYNTLNQDCWAGWVERFKRKIKNDIQTYIH